MWKIQLISLFCYLLIEKNNTNKKRKLLLKETLEIRDNKKALQKRMLKFLYLLITLRKRSILVAEICPRKK